jgi:hypothetical protein
VGQGKMRISTSQKRKKQLKKAKKSKNCISREIFLDFFKKPLAILLLI